MTKLRISRQNLNWNCLFFTCNFIELWSIIFYTERHTRLLFDMTANNEELSKFVSSTLCSMKTKENIVILFIWCKYSIILFGIINKKNHLLFIISHSSQNVWKTMFQIIHSTTTISKKLTAYFVEDIAKLCLHLVLSN